MKNKTIAILGVDGSGKSTVIENVAQLLGDQCVIQYMGSRSYEDTELEALINKDKLTIIELIKSIWLRYKCFYNRYKKAVGSGKIVLFDRYVHEIYINSRGIYKIIYTILYKYLYPKPNAIVYLYCSAEESLRRKDDIPSEEKFRAMKKRFDDCFLSEPSCYCLSSEENSPSELTDLIYNYITELYGKN